MRDDVGVTPPRRSTSVRLRRRKDVAKSEFLRSRRSGDWGEVSEGGVAETSTDRILFGPLGGRQWGAEGEEWSNNGDNWHQGGKNYLHQQQGGRSAVSDGEEVSRRRRRDVWRNSGVQVTDFGPIDGPSRLPGDGAVAEGNEEEARSRDQGVSYMGSQGVPYMETVYGTKEEIVQGEDAPLRKGLMWLQKGKLFSRWKERYLILTRDYLQFFKRSSSGVTECGDFLTKIRLSEVSGVEVADRRGYLTLELETGKEGVLLLRRAEGLQEWAAAIEAAWRTCARRRMASTEDFWKKRQANGAAIDVWLLNRYAALWQLFQPFCNSGTLETLVQEEIVRKNKENKEELGLEDAKTLQADQLQHLQSHLLLLRLRRLNPDKKVVMRRPASLLSVEKNGGRGKRRARSEYFGRGPPMEATDWESACSGVWLRRESEEKKEEKEERVSVSRIKEEEQENSKRRGEDVVVMRREGSRPRRTEEDQRRRFSGPPKLREGGSNESKGGQTGARRAGEAKLGAPAGLSARIQSSRPNNQRPVSRVIEIKGRPLERHELQQGGGHQHHEVDHQHHHQQQQGHFASADSGISSLNTSTTGSRKSARHTMIH